MGAVKQLTADFRAVDDGCVVRLAGELDMATHDQAAAIFEAAFGQADGGAVAIDLSGLRFIDASGVTALVRAQNLAEAVGLRVTLRGAHGLVARVLGLCGLTDIAETIAPKPGGATPETTSPKPDSAARETTSPKPDSAARETTSPKPDRATPETTSPKPDRPTSGATSPKPGGATAPGKAPESAAAGADPCGTGR